MEMKASSITGSMLQKKNQRLLINQNPEVSHAALIITVNYSERSRTGNAEKINTV